MLRNKLEGHTAEHTAEHTARPVFSDIHDGGGHGTCGSYRNIIIL